MGATQADQDIIDGNNGLLNTAPNLIDIKPLLKVGGQTVAVGATGIGAGRPHSSDMHFLAPVNAQGFPVNVVPAIFNSIIAGEYQAIGLSVDGVTNPLLAPVDPADEEGFLAQLRYATAMGYLERSLVADDDVGALLHVRITRDVADAIVKDQLLVSTDGSGNPVTWEWSGLTIDADRKVIGAWKVDEFETGCGGEGKEVLVLAGAEGSLNESLIFKEVTGGADIIVNYGGSQNPITNPPTTEAQAQQAVTVMKGYYARGSRGSWHTEAASQAHEGHHYTEWKCSSDHYGPTAETAIEILTVAYDAHANEAAAVTALRAGGSGADAINTTFKATARTYWFLLADNASSRPYAAGQLVLNAAIISVQTLAAANGWTVPAGVDTPSAATPCYEVYPAWNP